MRYLGRYARALVASLATCLFVGCGGEYSPTTGIVTVDGAPATGAVVIFHPTGEATECATGRCDEAGQFSLMTQKAGDGARPGDYVVTVVWLDESAPPKGDAPGDLENKAAPEDRLKGRYAAKGDASPKATVPPGGGELPPIELKTK